MRELMYVTCVRDATHVNNANSAKQKLYEPAATDQLFLAATFVLYTASVQHRCAMLLQLAAVIAYATLRNSCDTACNARCCNGDITSTWV